MKKITLLLTSLVLLTGIQGLSSCKKEKNTTATPTEDTSKQSQLSNDESIQSNESGFAMNDVNTVIENSGYRKSILIVGATIDSVVSTKQVIITYNGATADGQRVKAGQIIVQLTNGLRWQDPNAVLTVTFINYKVTIVSTNKSMTFNGMYQVTNVSGGLLRLRTPNTSITHKVGGSITITFDDGSQRVWTISKQRIIGLTILGTPFIYESGYGVKDSFSNVSVIGTDRKGVSFFTLINTPVISASTCSWFPISGIKIFKSASKDIVLTYGVDANGLAAIPPNCPFGFKINWINDNGASLQLVIAY